MRINNITSVNFGHSKKSRAYLEKSAQTLEDNDLKNSLLQYSSICNSMEDSIKKNEKKYGNAYSDSPMVDLFVSMKDVLLTQVAFLFDDGEKYLQSEYDYYSGSLEKCKEKEGNWREYLLEKLTFWDSTLGKSEKELKQELEEANKYKQIGQKQLTEVLETYGANLQANPETKETKAKSTADSPIIEKLEPNEGSPKGFEDIMGMEELKEKLKDDIIDPINNPKQAKLDFEEYGKKIPSGIMLYGPPGCGKTYIVQALAAEINSSVYAIDISNIGSKYVNQTANNIKQAFDFVYSEGDKSEKPVLIFMDEMDSLTKNRASEASSSNEDNKAVGTLLKYIENARHHNIIMIGATNRYDMIDPAIKRRFKRKEFVALPEKEQRYDLVKNNLKNKTKAQEILKDEEALDIVANMLTGFSCSSIVNITEDALENARKRNRAPVEICDFIKAIEETQEDKLKNKDYMSDEKRPSIGFNSGIFIVEPKK